MTKVVINHCFGGFSLSHEAIMRYAEIKGITLYVSAEASGYPSYYLCPPEEYVRISDEESFNPVSPERFARSNALYFSDRNIERNDPALVQVVEEMGESANGSCANLAVVEIPDDVEWHIHEYDGNEHVAENHRTWY